MLYKIIAYKNYLGDIVDKNKYEVKIDKLEINGVYTKNINVAFIALQCVTDSCPKGEYEVIEC